MKTISNEDYLQLLGLMTLAKNQYRLLVETAKTVESFCVRLGVSEKEAENRVSDSIYGFADTLAIDETREFLKRLELEVEEK